MQFKIYKSEPKTYRAQVHFVIKFDRSNKIRVLLLWASEFATAKIECSFEIIIDNLIKKSLKWFTLRDL